MLCVHVCVCRPHYPHNKRARMLCLWRAADTHAHTHAHTHTHTQRMLQSLRRKGMASRALYRFMATHRKGLWEAAAVGVCVPPAWPDEAFAPRFSAAARSQQRQRQRQGCAALGRA